MTTPPTFGRRRLLVGAAALGLAWMGRSLGAWPLQPVHVHAAEGARLAGILQQQRSARAIGRQYLRVVPSEARAELLASRIIHRLAPEHQALASVTDEQLRESLLLAVREDFEDGRTVQLRGWVLSQTEARLCAVVALYPSPWM